MHRMHIEHALYSAAYTAAYCSEPIATSRKHSNLQTWTCFVTLSTCVWAATGSSVPNFLYENKICSAWSHHVRLLHELYS
eukprot:m.28412 g.28412  ORF g.28412 m.28412 type:complete len:80 (+) comp12015_c0_seq2:113-352(+)